MPADLKMRRAYKELKKMKGKKSGFTVLEILLIIAIISFLMAAVFVSVSQSRRNARINSTKSVFKGALTAIVFCNAVDSVVSVPANPETGNKQICNNIPDAFWPALSWGYTYVAGGNYTSACDFQIDTNGDSANIRCKCGGGQSCQ
jgi:hypothetical protein